MTQAKISSYSSAKSIMVGVGKQNLLMTNNKPVTMAERYQYVPTAMVPNIGVSTADD